MPKGEDTMLDRNVYLDAQDLSGGQMQRLMLATSWTEMRSFLFLLDIFHRSFLIIFALDMEQVRFHGGISDGVFPNPGGHRAVGEPVCPSGEAGR